MPVAGALVDALGRADGVGMLLAQPAQSPVVASPTSSSAVAAKIRSPSGSKPSRASDAMATALAATWPFMSSAPRPQT